MDRPITAVLCAALLLVPVASRSAARADSTAAPRRVYSVRDLPGYTPLVDPESTSVVLGRRMHVPPTDVEFAGGAASLQDLARAICRSISSGSVDSLLALCVTDAEFREVLWREFPQSRPATGVTWTDAWTILFPRLRAGCSHAVRDHVGGPYTFIRFVPPDSTLEYAHFTMRSRLVAEVEDAAGHRERWRWWRAAVGRHGRWKIYSTED